MGRKTGMAAAILFLAGISLAEGQVKMEWIPEGRIIKWSPGVEGGVPTYEATVTLGAEDLPGDAKTDAGPAIQKAIDSAKTPGAVALPVGTFMVKQRLVMRSGVALVGAGLDKTELLLDVKGPGGPGAICMRGELVREEIAIDDGAKMGSTKLTLAKIGTIKAGTMIWVWQDSDAGLMFTKSDWKTEWGIRSMGQIVRASAVDGQTVTIDTPLRLEYKKELRPRLMTIRPITGSGIEGIHLKRLDKSDDSIVGITNAEDCWVRDCETEYCFRGHVSISASRHVTVQNCYIHHAHDYGGGGHGYGASLADCTSDCLIENNVFNTLRHAMITQTGANGNVFGYNYSFAVAGSDDEGKQWFHSGDISVHGHYTYATLFEGNTVQRAGVGDFWGPAGPRVTLFRNRIATPERELDEARWKEVGMKRTAMGIEVRDSSHMTNVIGNTLAEGAVQVEKSCKDVMVEGNLVGGKMVWNQAKGGKLPASLYLAEKPAFWGNRPWPGIGADVDESGMRTTTPAQDWWQAMKKAKKGVPFAK